MILKNIIKRIFKKAGLEIRPTKKRSKKTAVNSNAMPAGLTRLARIGIAPNCIVDIGAARGEWTLISRKVWENAKFILVEPILEQIQNIPESLKNNKNISIIEGVAGEERGTAQLTITSDLDGSGIYDKKSTNSREVKKIPVDEILKNEQGPFLLKLDTHGYELPIFEGAERSLENSVAVIVEVYGFHVSPTGKLFYEICDFLDKKEFRLFDIVDIMRREKDQAFWQADAIFIKKNHSAFEDSSY